MMSIGGEGLQHQCTFRLMVLVYSACKRLFGNNALYKPMICITVQQIYASNKINALLLTMGSRQRRIDFGGHFRRCFQRCSNLIISELQHDTYVNLINLIKTNVKRSKTQHTVDQ